MDQKTDFPEIDLIGRSEDEEILGGVGGCSGWDCAAVCAVDCGYGCGLSGGIGTVEAAASGALIAAGASYVFTC